jgi:hypothetical protein
MPSTPFLGLYRVEAVNPLYWLGGGWNLPERSGRRYDKYFGVADNKEVKSPCWSRNVSVSLWPGQQPGETANSLSLNSS